VKLAALFSGGKDSTYSILRAKETGHEIACLIAMRPASDESMLFHYPNSWVAARQAETMKIPSLAFEAKGNKDDEVNALERAVMRTKSLYGIEGVVFGGIASRFQKDAFEGVCHRQRLQPVAPLWGIEPEKYMAELLDRGFEIIVVGVSAMGLGKEWLGATIDRTALSRLVPLAKKFGFNLAFEGGEAETLVTDCPLFGKRLHIKDARTHWDGQRGMFEILEVELVDK
jgi:ABC transporter with metal-binding/Fe-S-binding domain ATP-binding protein